MTGLLNSIKGEILKIDGLLEKEDLKGERVPEKAYRDFFYNVAVAYERHVQNAALSGRPAP